MVPSLFLSNTLKASNSSFSVASLASDLKKKKKRGTIIVAVKKKKEQNKEQK